MVNNPSEKQPSQRENINKKSIKKGVPLYSNLVNLKSNTMKNTLQR